MRQQHWKIAYPRHQIQLKYLLITVQENNQSQEEGSNSPHSSLAELDLFYDSTRIANRPAPIQPVEPVIGLTTEEQCRREDNPNLTLDELLGLSSY